MLGSSLLSLQNEILSSATQQGKIPGLISDVCQSHRHWGRLFNIFNCIFYPVQLQMVIFDFKEEGTEPNVLP